MEETMADLADRQALGLDPPEPEDGPDARDLAGAMAVKVGLVLIREGHGDCEYSEAATVAVGSDGGVRVVCGCGQYYDAPELNTPSRVLSPAQVDARGTSAVTVAAADPIARTLAQLDMTRPLSPAEVESHLLDSVNRLENGGAFERFAIEQLAAAQKAYDNAFARAYNRATGPVRTREMAAHEECEDEANTLADAKMMELAVRRALHSLRAEISGYQSLLRSAATAYQTGGGGRAF